MKLVFVVCFCAVAAIIMYTAQAAPQNNFEKFDNIDVESILNNDRLLRSYFKCLMDTGKCTQEGEELKRRLPEAMESKCEGCTNKQKKSIEKVITFLVKEKNDMWKQLSKKHDPKEIYRQKFEEDAKKLDIAV